MDNFNYKKFIYEGSLTKNDDTKETLNENAPGYNTRKFGEALPTLESVKAAYEDGNAKEKDLEDDSYEVDGSSVGDGKYEDDESRMQAKEKVKETLDDDVWDKIEAFRDAVNDDEYVISSLIKAMSTDDANLYLDAIMRDHNFEDGSLDHLDVVSSKFSEPLAEGVWKIGNPDDVNNFIEHTTEMKRDYWNVVGSDEVMDGLDQAIKGAEKLLHTALNPLRGGGSYNKEK